MLKRGGGGWEKGRFWGLLGRIWKGSITIVMNRNTRGGGYFLMRLRSAGVPNCLLSKMRDDMMCHRVKRI